MYAPMKIHQRGFYGNGKVGTMSRQDPPDIYANRPLDAPTVSTFVASEEVAKVYNAYVQHSYSVEDFDWIANSIAVLIKAFGTPDLQTWHAQQYNSPSFSDMHVDFLEDCFKFALTGKSNLDMFTWAHLLEPGTDQAERADLKEYTAQYLQKDTVYPFTTEGRTVAQFISDILCKNGGLDFAFGMVNIMFTGKR